MASFGAHPSDTHSRSDSTIHYGVTAILQPTTIATQLRPVTSVWLGAVRRSVQVRLCTSGCKSEKMFGVISPPRDLLPSIILYCYCYYYYIILLLYYIIIIFYYYYFIFLLYYIIVILHYYYIILLLYYIVFILYYYHIIILLYSIIIILYFHYNILLLYCYYIIIF